MKWEYLIKEQVEVQTSGLLDKYGEEGWELVTVVPDMAGKAWDKYIFKREKKDG